MDQNQVSTEQLKLQKIQLYVQVAGLFLSAFFLYTIISGKGKIQEVDAAGEILED